MNNMDHSLIYQRIYFFRSLRSQSSSKDREGHIKLMNIGMMNSFIDIVKFIIRGDISLLYRDYREFKRYYNVLRQMTSPRLSLARKRQVLIRYHKLLPRILREEYLQAAIRLEIKRFLPVAPAA